MTGIDPIVGSHEIIRPLNKELVPEIMLQEDLGHIIKWLCKHMEKNHGLIVTLSEDGEIKIRNEDIRLFLYQSVQELILNVVNHSGMKFAGVKLSKDKNNGLQITVSDDGRGFDPASLPKRMKLDNTLGLYAMLEQISRLKGSMELKTVPGEGISGTFTLPVEVVQSPDRPKHEIPLEKTAGANRGERGGKTRVLVADDHRLVREGIIALFENDPGINIVGEASNGKEAVEMALNIAPDVILMDVNMPGIDGIEATRTISAIQPEIRIVGLSIDDDETTMYAMLSAGASDFLSKNSNASQIKTMVQKRTSSKVSA